MEKLDRFIEKNMSLSEFGFCSNRSTALTVMHIVEDIARATDDKKYTVGVFVGLQNI